jgi:hypothetical protein
LRTQVGSRIADARVNVLQMVQNKKSYYLGQADTYIKPGYAVSSSGWVDVHTNNSSVQQSPTPNCL